MVTYIHAISHEKPDVKSLPTFRASHTTWETRPKINPDTLFSATNFGRINCFFIHKMIKNKPVTAKLNSFQLETRYEQYFHQMDTVVSAFEAIAGVGAAASYTALTIQAMSKHFSNLRDAIINQLNAQKDSLSKDTSRNYGCASSRQKKEALHHLGMIQIGRVWRPLRGLPEESVAHLRSWLFEHFLHP